jgi:hypothetical protein
VRINYVFQSSSKEDLGRGGRIILTPLLLNEIFGFRIYIRGNTKENHQKSIKTGLILKCGTPGNRLGAQNTTRTLSSAVWKKRNSN